MWETGEYSQTLIPRHPTYAPGKTSQTAGTSKAMPGRSRQVSKFCGSTGSKEKSGSRLAVLRTFNARSKYSKFTAAAGSRVGATYRRPTESKDQFPEAQP